MIICNVTILVIFYLSWKLISFIVIIHALHYNSTISYIFFCYYDIGMEYSRILSMITLHWKSLTDHFLFKRIKSSKIPTNELVYN